MSDSGRVWACDFGLQPGSGFKMRPVYKSAVDFTAAALSDGSNW